MARSHELLGPYEEPPRRPLRTARDDPNSPLQKSGHACFVQKGDEWYITHLCARPLTQRGGCPLGRETALQKIECANGWPRLANGTCHPDLEVSAPAVCGVAAQREDFSEQLNFAGLSELPLALKSLRGGGITIF